MTVKNYIATAIVALAALFASLPAAAQEVLTIDLPRAQAETELGLDIQRQLAELIETMGESLQTADDTLQADYRELTEQHENFIITEEVYQQRMAEIQQRGQGLAMGLERMNQVSQIAGSRAEAAFFQSIYPDVEAVLEERGGAALMSRNSLVMSSDDIDITSAVITRVNNRITSLEVQLLPQRPEGEGAGAN